MLILVYSMFGGFSGSFLGSFLEILGGEEFMEVLEMLLYGC